MSRASGFITPHIFIICYEKWKNGKWKISLSDFLSKSILKI